MGFVTDICGGLELLHMCHVYALISGFLLLDGAIMEKKKIVLVLMNSTADDS